MPSTCPDKVRQATDQLYSGDPQVTVRLTKPYRNETLRQQDEELLTQICYSFLQQSEYQSSSTLIRDMKLETFGVGWAALMSTLNVRTYPEEPTRNPGEKLKDWRRRQAEYEARRREVSPFEDRVIHPLNICWDLAHKPSEWVLIREAIEVGTAADEYPHWKQADSYKGTSGGQGSAVIYACRAWFWTREYVGCFLNGEPAYDSRDGADENGIMDNPYGFIPIWPAAGGHGQPDMMGRPAYELKGMIRDARDLLLTNAILYNLMLIWMHRASYGPKDWIKGPDDPTIVNRIRNAILGGPNVIENLPEPYSIDHEDVPTMPDVLLKLWTLNLQEIDKAMFADILSGQSTTSEPAARTRERLKQVDKRLNDATLHITQAVEGWLRGKLKMLKHVLSEETAWNIAPVGKAAKWVTLKPDMIPYDDEIVLTVDLTGDSADEQGRETQTLTQRLGTSMDLMTMLTQLKEPNPEEIVAGMERDALRQTSILPTLQKVFDGMVPQIVAQVAQDAGILFTPEELQAVLPQPPVMSPATGQPMAPMVEPQPAGQIAPQGPPQAGGPVQVGPNGVVLPGIPGQPAESVNPGVQMPGTPEADAQAARLLRRPLPVPVG